MQGGGHVDADRPAPAPEPTLSLLSAPLRALTVGSVALVSLGAFEAIAVATAMPTVAAALDGVAAYALAFGLPLATSVIGMVLAGVWSDARGPAGSMRVGVAAFVLGLLVAGLAPAMPVLVAGRAVQGLGSGLFSVALYVVVGRVVPAALRPRIFAAFAAAWLLPAVAGPPLAGLIVEQWAGAGCSCWPRCWRCRRRCWWSRGWAGAGGARSGSTGPRAARAAGAVGGRGRVRGGRAAPGRAAVRTGRGGARGGGAGRGGAVRAAAAAGRSAAGPPGAAQRDPGPRADLGRVPRRRDLPAAAAVPGARAVPDRGRAGAHRGRGDLGHRLLVPGPRAGAVAGAAAAGRDRVRRARRAAGRGGGVPAVPVAVAVLGWASAGLGMGLAYPMLSVLTLELSAPHEQGTNSSALQIADALFAAVVLAVSGALFAALVAAGPIAYLAATAVAGAPGAGRGATAGRATTQRP